MAELGREVALLEFIEKYTAQHGYPPNQREMAKGIERALSNTHDRLWRLIRAGRISHAKGKVRSYRVVRP